MYTETAYALPPTNGAIYQQLPPHHASHAAHAAYAAQWLHQQAYFPPPTGTDGHSTEHAESPGSNGTGYDVGQIMEGQAEWQHIFMQSMGV